MRAFTILLALAASPVLAATVSVDEPGDAVTIAGDFSWFEIADGIPLARYTTPYSVTFSRSGSPWDPAFTAPAETPGGVTTVAFPEPASLSIGNPKALIGNDSGQVQAGVLNAGGVPPADLPANATARAVGAGDLIRLFPASGLDGDRTYSFLANFNEDYSELVAVTAYLRVRTPIITTDIYTTEFWGAVDRLDLPLAVRGSGAEPTPQPPSPVPLPAGAPLLCVGLAALGMLRRRR